VVASCERITPAQVEHGITALKQCYQVVAAPRGGGLHINGVWVPGVAGNRPPKRFR